MCGRFALSAAPAEIKDDLSAEHWENEAEYLPNFNIAPTQYTVVATRADEIEIGSMRWGLIPRWAKDSANAARMINARRETLTEKPSFRNLLLRHRCVVPASGYFEWKSTGAGKQPYYIFHGGGRPLLLAGLWDQWQSPTDGTIRSFAIVTRDPIPDLAPIHDRMPAILSPAAASRWLDTRACPQDGALALLQEQPRDLRFHPVSTTVNSVRNNTSDNIRPLRVSSQTSLETPGSRHARPPHL